MIEVVGVVSIEGEIECVPLEKVERAPIRICQSGLRRGRGIGGHGSLRRRLHTGMRTAHAFTARHKVRVALLANLDLQRPEFAFHPCIPRLQLLDQRAQFANLRRRSRGATVVSLRKQRNRQTAHPSTQDDGWQTMANQPMPESALLRMSARKRSTNAEHEIYLLRRTSGLLEPRAQSPEPRAQSQEPRAQSPEPRAQSQEPRAKSQEPAFHSR